MFNRTKLLPKLDKYASADASTYQTRGRFPATLRLLHFALRACPSQATPCQDALDDIIVLCDKWTLGEALFIDHILSCEFRFAPRTPQNRPHR